MKYYSQFGKGDDVWEQEYRFEQRGDQLVALVGRGDAVEEHVVDFAQIGDGNVFSLIVDGVSKDIYVEVGAKGVLNIQMSGEWVEVISEDERHRAARAVASSRSSGVVDVEAVMPGVVVSIEVEEGQEVKEGQTILVLEAMKMQNPLQAERDGVITKLHCKAGEAVAGGTVLAVLE